MNALPAVQRAFLASLFAASPSGDARIEVYRRGALANLAAALAATYPVVLRLVGEAFFGEAARRHALGEPSTSGNLDDYGAAFADFLAAYPHARDLPYLADVARLEWAMHESRRAPEAPALDPASLAEVDADHAETVELTLHPSVRLVASPHPVLAIWEANQSDRDGTLLHAAGPECVIVFRKAGAVRSERLGEGEWKLAAALRDGATLGVACDAMGDAAQGLPAALARLATLGVLRA
jgi:hypothetical protein